MLRVVTFSSLFPNSVRPTHGIFVAERLRHLCQQSAVAAEVVAPVPWFPWAGERFGRYGEFARVGTSEQHGGFTVHYPRHLVIPKFGMTTQPALMVRGTWRCVADVVQRQGAKLIDAHYLYPDGVAAAAIAQRLGLPYVLTARGSDVNQIGEFPACRQMMLRAIEGAVLTITVSEALRRRLLDWGVAADRVVTIRNGIDRDKFSPQDQRAARTELGIEPDARLLLSVGKLDTNKGHHLVIESLLQLPDTQLCIAGDGPARADLLAQVERLRLGDRVRLLGAVPHAKLAKYYGAANALVLAAEREGLPNVVLESLACGTPVVATRVGGIPEIMLRAEQGQLLSERSAEAIAAAVRAVLTRNPPREEVAASVQDYDWQRTSEQLVQAMKAVVSRAGRL